MADGLSPAATPPGCGDPAATEGLADPTRIAAPSPRAIAAMASEENVATRRLDRVERLVRRGTWAWLRSSREGRRGLLMILAVTAKNGGA
jgi:hypothetical protein